MSHLVACRFELPSSKSGSGDVASDREVFIKPVVKLDDAVFSISLKATKLNIEREKKNKQKTHTQFNFFFSSE